eukprot:CAMPEP_0197497060 /NCGR_PEP_ID=MMETSP1311-20131121/48918_1 /TAXON_ID=464262 /ORGANISM="Genus nov. species nov., Strain RCC856" /LENGTH=78 /DNA_ID=CAMNT_0043042699 /DNA_START=8 /DNA_END=241 /DNA_ORIENTATION=-
MATSKLWDWAGTQPPLGSGSDLAPYGPLLSEVLSFGASFGQGDSADDGAGGGGSTSALSVLVLRATLCLYALGQTRVI